MKRKYIALTLLLVMMFALAACGKSETPAATEAPAEEAAAPAEAQEAAPAEQAEAPAEQAEAPAEAAPAGQLQGIEPDSGVYTFSDPETPIRFDYDSKYAAFRNPAGNVTVFAGDVEGVPYCTVSVIDNDAAADAVSYLKSLAESSEVELGKNLKTKAAEPQKIAFGDRDIYYIFYTYADKEAGGNVVSAYYAEDLATGGVAVYNSNALEGQTADVDSILKLAIETFSLAV